jgi:4-amino-4-deoxy-L-arabinose transferase-like glycosyltransferase
MSSLAAEQRRPLAYELTLVLLVSAAVLLPGIGSYSLVDPWETHYGEVGRMMLQSHDLVHTQWPGTNSENRIDEGFRSKPVLMFWLMAAGLRSMGVAVDGGYSGEMVASARTMIGLRLPFVLTAIFGLAMMWWMLARLVSRRLAWLSLVVVGSAPMYCLVARQAIADMPLTATVTGAIALFALAIEDGACDCSPRARKVTLALVVGMIAWQAICYFFYFLRRQPLAVRQTVPPALWLPVMMALLVLALWSAPWRWLRRGLAVERWKRGRAFAEHVLGMAPITTTRQLYLLGCHSLLGIGLLAKGPPGLAVVGLVGVLHLVMRNRWRALYDGEFEFKRGLLVILATALPWHLAMFLKDGLLFINEYVMFHILDRGGVGVDKSPGTFEYYTSQIGYGMWLWAALLPAAFAATLMRARDDSRESRVRMLVGMWAIGGFFFFAIVPTKFHHYILPALPALGILVAWFLDDVLAGRDRLHPLYAGIAIAIVLLITRDLTCEPQRWINMFIFRYDRPWPWGEPWGIDPSDGILALGLVAAAAIAMCATRFRRLGVAAIGAAGLAICIWVLQVYMPIAGTHWGMREAVRTYYEQRTIYGEKLVYFGAGELWDDWHDATDTVSFDTFIPSNLQVGQPMTIEIQLRKPDNDQLVDETFRLVGTAVRVGAHTIDVQLAHGERGKLPLAANGPRGRSPIRVVDADPLIAWQLYWRGENFWSQEEIWGFLPEMKTSFPTTDNSLFNRYINDHARAPVGRRYFILGETSRIQGPKSSLPTQRARDSYEVLDTTSNKFGLAAFYL